MYKYFSNEKTEIYFDGLPQVSVRYYIPSMTREEKRAIEKYPFICKKHLKVKLKDIRKNKTYEFVIPKGYCYDGASIPRVFWRIIGANTDNRFLIPALIHDILCENHNYVDNDRGFSTEVFNALLESSGINKPKRCLMKNSVACYQTLFCNWKNGET